MHDISDIIFLDDCNAIEQAKKKYGFIGYTGIVGSEYFLVPISDQYYLIVYNGNGYFKESFLQDFKGKTTIWIISKFKNINDASSYYQLTDSDINSLRENFSKVITGINSISFDFDAKTYKDIITIHDVICDILNVRQRNIIFNSGYDKFRDGCMCRVCGYWYSMAPSDRLSDGKFNCWNCKTYRQYSCMIAVESLTK